MPPRTSQGARRLFGAAAGLRAAFGGSQPPNDRALNEQYISTARATVGADAFASCWSAGEQMSLDAAIAYGLDDG